LIRVKILNQTKNTTIAQEAAVAETPLTRITGLLGKKTLERRHALILKPCNSIHTFFMQFSIDALFVDKNKIVVALLPGLKPFCFSRAYFKAQCVIEMPAGTIAETATAVGDTLAFV